MGHPQALGQNLAQNQQQARKAHGKQSREVRPELRQKSRASHRGPGRIGNGVKGKNSGNGPVDLQPQLVEHRARWPAGPPQPLNGRPRQRIEHGFRQGTQKTRRGQSDERTRVSITSSCMKPAGRTRRRPPSISRAQSAGNGLLAASGRISPDRCAVMGGSQSLSEHCEARERLGSAKTALGRQDTGRPRASAGEILRSDKEWTARNGSGPKSVVPVLTPPEHKSPPRSGQGKRLPQIHPILTNQSAEGIYFHPAPPSGRIQGGVLRVNAVRRGKATAVGPLHQIKHGGPLTVGHNIHELPQMLAPAFAGRIRKTGASSSTRVTFALYPKRRQARPAEQTVRRLWPRRASRVNCV